ncbi:MAG TPA: GGDEF domain-containing protein [Anaerolineales bacterium]|nr:GGDEF domain-containing protein [Anaerolineales bacterium]
MEADTSRRSLLRTPAGVVTSITALGVAAYTAWIFSSSYRLRADIFVSSLGLVALYACLCAFGVYVALQRDYTPALRRAWLMFALGSLSNLLAEGLHFSNQVFLEIPAYSDPVYLLRGLSYPLTLAGLLFLPLAFVPRQERGILWLDLGVLATFFGMAIWYYFLASPQFSYADEPGKVWAMAYPVGDFLILAGLVALIQRDLSRAARWIVSLLVMAILFSVGGDLFFAYHELNEISYSPAYLTVFNLGAVQMQLIAAARQIASGAGILSDPPARFSPVRHLFRLALPYLAVIVGLALLTVIIHTSLSPDPRLLGVLYGSYGLVGFVLLRQYVVLRENVRLYQKMRRVAWTDSLTGVYNRHFFNEILPREMVRASRYNKQLSILLLDMDGFKEFNDTYGHLQGDVALKAIARIFAAQLRSSDTIARFGGDEFVVILPETNRRMAKATAERIRNAVKSQSQFDTKMSVSAGIAVYRSELSPEGLLEEADQDLYRQKNLNGRSQA